MSHQPNETTTIYLCRHGESPWNVEGRIQGQLADAPGLDDLGHEQARLLGERMRSAGVDVLVTSDLRRAVETAGYVSSALDLKPVQDSRWRELDLGAWQGLTRGEVAERWPGMLEAVRRGEDPPRGGGETYGQLGERTVATIDDVAQRYTRKTICVVCHGGNVRAALLNLPDPLDGVDPRSVSIPNTSVTVLRVADDRAEVVSLPDVSHLDRLASFNEKIDDEPR